MKVFKDKIRKRVCLYGKRCISVSRSNMYLHIIGECVCVCVTQQRPLPSIDWLLGDSFTMSPQLSKQNRTSRSLIALPLKKATSRFKKQHESLMLFSLPIHLPSTDPVPLPFLPLSPEPDNTLFRASDQGEIISCSPPSPLQLHLHNCCT